MSALSSGAQRVLSGLLEARTGQQLAHERLWRIETALKPLMRAGGYAGLDALASAVVSRADPDLADRVVDALLNNETFFLRDHAVFQLLDGLAFDAVRAERMAEKRISIWCAGCSTGQEAYSIAMLFAEAPSRWLGWKVDIVATDISAGAIDRAVAGEFSQFEIQRGLPIRLMMRWFDQDGEIWRIAPQIGRAVRFQRHNLLDRPPAPMDFDIVLCRNVLLYFPAETRRRAFERIAQAIAPHGMLMLGASETVIGQTDRFTSTPELRGLYRPVAQRAVRAA